MKIFKYPIRIEDYQEIPMPRGAHILCVQMQGEGKLVEHPDGFVTTSGQACIWAAVDPAATPVMRRFRLAGTGHDVSDIFNAAGSQFGNDTLYVGTFQMARGQLVWHLFDLGETS